MSKEIKGFSKLSKKEKINWLVSSYFKDDSFAENILKQYWNSNESLQNLHDEFSENSISNYYLPFSIAPNFLINDKKFTIPMTIEESSVVAAAGKAAKFWMKHGGFKAEVINDEKIGQVHFFYHGNKKTIIEYFDFIKPILFKGTISDILSKTSSVLTLNFFAFSELSWFNLSVLKKPVKILFTVMLN